MASPGKSQMKADNYSLLEDNDFNSFLLVTDNNDLSSQSLNLDDQDFQKKRKKRKSSRRGKKGSSSGLSVGFKAGGNLANIGGDAEGTDMTFGIAVGAFGQYPINDMFAVVAELNFEQKGYKESLDIFGVKFDIDTKLNYLTIPLMGRLLFGDNIKLYVNAGPYFGISAGGKIIADGESDSIEGIASLDIGVIGGGGVIIPVSDSFSLMVDLRYAQGFTTIFKDSDANVTNSAIGFNVGAVIPL